MKIIDISLQLTNKTIFYPGNVPLSFDIHHAMPEHTTQLSTITMGSHTGTHIDAPAHCIEGALMLDKIPLETFIGPCRVLDFSRESGESVTLEMIKAKNIKTGERILLKTKNSIRGFEEFYDDYIYLDGDTADYLANLNILIIGIDFLSIKKRGGQDNRPHSSFLSKNIPIIEGLNMVHVEEGEYDLVCLPLNFINIEGAPARVVLLQK